jgi:hypothetical protein
MGCADFHRYHLDCCSVLFFLEAEFILVAELFTLPLIVENLIVKPSSDVFLATEFRGIHRMPSNHTYLVDLSKSATDPSVTVRELPFSIRQLAWYPSPNSEDVHLAIVTRLGDVYLAGDAPDRIVKSGSAGRLPETRDKDVGLLDEIFGPRETPSRITGPELQASPAEVKEMPKVLDMPMHLLPPMQLLWRDVIGPPRIREEGDKTQAIDRGNGGVEAVDTDDDEMEEDEEAPGVVRTVDGLSNVPGVVDIFKDLIATSDI